MNIYHSLILSLSVAAILPAQTQLVRGKVEDVRNTTNQFYLDGTTIPLVSQKLNLNTLVGSQAELQVVNVGTSSKPVLRVESAKVLTLKMFDMGNLRFGKEATWEVNAPRGSKTAVLAAPLAWTSYAPLGPMGTWLLGPNAVLLTTGVTNNLNQFQFKFTMPNIPILLGVEFTGQAAVETNRVLMLSNPDSKVVENR